MGTPPPPSPWPVLVALALALPVGSLLLRLLPPAPHEQRGVPASNLAVSVALGFAAMLCLFALVRPWGSLAIVPVVAAACAWVERRRLAALFAAREVGEGFLGALALGLLAWWACGADSWTSSAGLFFRSGFDVSDRAFYALVGRELAREPLWALQNPLFAGAPLAYSILPPAVPGFLHEYAATPLLDAALAHAPVLGCVLLGLTLNGLLLELGVNGRTERVVTALLVVLGGDLSWLFSADTVTGLHRTRHFLVFHSFSAETLYYNPWMFGLPLVFATLVVVRRWLEAPRRRTLILLALLGAFLWETKAFALIGLFLGLLAAAFVLRKTSLLLAALALGAGALPHAALIGFQSAGSSTLMLRPLRLVATSAGTWGVAWLAPALDPGARPAAWLALLAATVVFLAGAFGMRFFGLVWLRRAARRDAAWAVVAATIVASLLLSLLVVGSPVEIDGVQFMVLALALAWLPTGPALFALLPRFPLLVVLVIAAAVVSPGTYLLQKRFPTRLTPAGAVDRVPVVVEADVVRAALWLSQHSTSGQRLALPPWGGPGGWPLYVALLADKRLLAHSETLSVAAETAAARRAALGELYATRERSRADALLESLEAHWLLEDLRAPLPFSSGKLVARFRSGHVVLHEVVETHRAYHRGAASREDGIHE